MEAGGKLGGNTFVQIRKDDDLNIFVVVKMKRSRYVLDIENTGLDDGIREWEESRMMTYS